MAAKNSKVKKATLILFRSETAAILYDEMQT